MRWPRLWVRCSFIGLTSLVPATPAAAQVVTVLHSFGGSAAGDGSNPTGSLLLSGSTLYGMTGTGGVNHSTGTIFKIGADGSGYSVTRSFGQYSGDGQFPGGSLIQSGSALFGLTEGGGSAGNGTIFQIGTNGISYSVSHSFLGGPGDGSEPFGTLVQSGSSLFGLTYGGGASSTATATAFTKTARFSKSGPTAPDIMCCIPSADIRPTAKIPTTARWSNPVRHCTA